METCVVWNFFLFTCLFVCLFDCVFYETVLKRPNKKCVSSEKKN